MVNAETGVRGYLLVGDRDFLAPYQAAQTNLPIVLANLERSIGTDHPRRAQLDSIRSQIRSIEQLMAAVQTTSPGSARSQLLNRGKQEMDALRQAINTAQKIEQVALDRERTNLVDLQVVIQSLQQLFTVTGVMSTVGGIYLFQLLAQELRQRQTQIQTRDSLIDTLTTDIIDGVLILDRSGQIETVNPALIDLLGYAAVDLLECPLMRLFVTPTTRPSQPLPQLITWLQQQPKLGRIWQLTAYHRRGTSVPIELSMSQIAGENQWIAIVRDVSAQANLMRQLQKIGRAHV